MSKPADYLVEASRLIVTLSAAGTTVVATFRESFSPPDDVPVAIIIYFVFSIISVALGLLTILTVAGSIQKTENKSNTKNRYTRRRDSPFEVKRGGGHNSQRFDIYSEPLQSIFMINIIVFWASLIALIVASLVIL